MPHSREIKSETKEGYEGKRRRDANEKDGPESGVERVNNGRTEEIVMEDWLRGIWKGINLY